MTYDAAAAERLDKVYLGSDVAAQRQDTIKRLAVAAGEHVLDVGCGPGYLAPSLADATGPKGRVVGVDLSPEMIARATSKPAPAWLSYQVADAADLPFDDASFDVVVSTQVAEYVSDIEAFCAEVHRVLRPGGRVLILATDWDAVCWHSEDPDRMDRVMAAFAPHCARSRLPRTLGQRLRSCGLHLEDVGYFPIVNVDRYDGCYSAGIVPFIQAYVSGQGTIPDAELEAWAQEQVALDARGAHFFATGRFSFLVTKPGADGGN